MKLPDSYSRLSSRVRCCTFGPEVQTLYHQVSALERGPPDGREGAAWTASSLAADPANIGAFVQADAVPRLLQMLKTGAHMRLAA